jgi:hypothetical protein
LIIKFIRGVVAGEQLVEGVEAIALEDDVVGFAKAKN